MSVKTYDPKGVIVVVGVVPMTGYAEGTFVKVSRNNPSWKPYKGADGTGSRAKSNDRSGKIEITLAQTSSSNDILTALQIADEQFGTGVVPVMVNDVNGTTLHKGSAAWVAKPADWEGANKVSETAWEIYVDDLDMSSGGNNSVGI